MATLQYHAFGGLEVVGPAGHLDLGTRKQRALLAVLLLEEGRTVSVDRLVDDVWGGAPPQRAEASLHAYVSTLRRALEPDRAPRQQAQVLVRRGAGYALLVGPQDVDFRRFSRLVDQARRRLDAGDLPGAAADLDDALGSYAPLLPDFEGEPWCEPDRVRLARLHRAAVRLSYDVRLQRGDHRLLEPELRAAALADPLDEELWAMLAIALYRSGRQGDALQAVADCKRALADQLGVDPGPRLRRLEVDLLAQAPALVVVEAPTAAAVPAQRHQPADAAVASPAARADVPGGDHPTVGRVHELQTLVSVVDRAVDRQHAVAVVEAEAGAGKTHLLTAASTYAEEHGAQVVWGRCSHGAGAPALWPWVQVAGALRVGHEPAADPADPALATLLAPGAQTPPGPADAATDPSASFRQSEALVQLVHRVARCGPLVLVVDDLHWADDASLSLLEHLGARLPPGTALLVGLRPPTAHAARPLAEALGALARSRHHERIALEPLPLEGVARVVEQETGVQPDEATASAIHARTGGNAFFVREVARLLHRTGRLTGGDTTVDVGSEVPRSVLDVVRARLASLPADCVDLLRLAAVSGRDVDLRVLAAAAGDTLASTYERLGPAVDDGVLVSHPQRAGWWRFAHDLVRDAVISTTAPLSAPRLHLQVADAFAAVHPDSAVEPLAFHLWSAGPLADPERTAGALLAAAQAALAKNAHTAAQQHLELAAGVARSAQLDALELQALTALAAVASARVGYAGGDPEWFTRGEQLARRLDRPRDVGHLLYARWAAASQSLRLDESARCVEALREYVDGRADPVLHLYAALASGIDHWDRGRIGEAHRCLQRATAIAAAHADLVRGDVMRFDLELLLPAFVGIVQALHGEVDAARATLAGLERGAVGDPYRTVLWAQFGAITESLVGDVDRALATARRGLQADPDGSFPFLGTLILVEYWWAVALLAMRDGAPDAAAEAAHACHELEQVVTDIRHTGTLTGEPGNLALLAEALLVSGRLDDADGALAQARASMERHGQRADEPLVLLVQARLQRARGEPAQAVLATIGAARTLAEQREAHLFVRQADALAAELDAPDAAASTPLATA
ncbi:BTAD domain-containing putative transcriptional regulator [Angustibacter sp. Root456]|uniref:BTAD domain-containing putative transcriptional regulator n=1 Tax=Angustibacter sp. Root456 TaxID=1736539 RepID=UPI0006F2E069|nr:BTAD domain-containing putative transcriptional regulator [Angustibacter sp. Root456]KQX64426.1 hypothetical protein ASD06_09625 [Angustibacter sp. Root456]